MASSRRTTIYLDDALFRALRLKSAATDLSVSDLVNRAVREQLAEDADDLRAFRDREAEPSVTYEDFVAQLRRRGEL
jgi:hypothetical protein